MAFFVTIHPVCLRSNFKFSRASCLLDSSCPVCLYMQQTCALHTNSIPPTTILMLFPPRLTPPPLPPPPPQLHSHPHTLSQVKQQKTLFECWQDQWSNFFHQLSHFEDWVGQTEELMTKGMYNDSPAELAGHVAAVEVCGAMIS